jgi:outer membrane protein with beta-barrel domain
MSHLMLRRMVPALLTAAGLAVAVPGTALAQGGVALTPWAGAYIPTKNEISDLDNALSRDVSVIGGARLTFWGTGMLGFEATGGYAPAKIADETINETRNTNLLVASGRLLLALSPVTNPVGFYIGAGPALLTRGRDTFDSDQSSTDFGGTAGAGLRFALGETGRTALRLDVEDYFYNGDFGGGDEFQNDVIASLGLEIGLGGRADPNEP